MDFAVFAGLLSGALWGFAFVVPKIVVEYNSGLIALGRFTFFGLISLLVLVYNFRNLRGLFAKTALKNALIFALLGNSLYYFFLVLGIRLAGVTMASLLVGLLPVTVAVAGSGGKITKRMRPSLLLIFTGILLVNFDTLQKQKNLEASLSHVLWGMVFLLGALALWTWYAVANAKFLKQHSSIPSNMWSSLTGAFTLMFSPVIALVQLGLEGGGFSGAAIVSGPAFLKFLLWSSVLGVGSSWLALWLWNIASKKLPTALSGQLIVSETLFALLYGFIWERRLPDGFEMTSILCMVGGVIMAVRSFER